MKTKICSDQLKLIVVFLILMTNCTKKSSNEETSNIQIPEVLTIEASKITSYSAESGGNCNDGVPLITAKGVCWSTSHNPTTNSTKTIDGNGAGSFISNIKGLTPNTVYYIRAYATNKIGTGYGNEVTFTTSTALTVTTTAVTDIAPVTATCGGVVTTDGGFSITTRGVCWNTSSNPTILDSHTTDGNGIGAFTSNLTGLAANTIYHIRAYAINSEEIAYGNEVTFTTLNPTFPIVTTFGVSDIAQFTAKSGGNVTSDEGAPVTIRGICWSTSLNPTTTNSHTTDGSDTGKFVSNMTGLDGSTLYYVRAYATNDMGTGYGNEVTFTTLHFIGESFGGGKIFYIDGTGMHGLIAATTDQAETIWGCYGTDVQGTFTAIGTGQANTTAIINTCLWPGIAAQVCNDLVLNGYDDWFLPSKDELNQMYVQRNIIGGFNGYKVYWSSSQDAPNEGKIQYFFDGSQGWGYKDSNFFVRANRAF